jgi:hypothetical protein
MLKIGHMGFVQGRGHLSSKKMFFKIVNGLGDMLGSLTGIFPEFVIGHFSKFRNLF